MFVSIFLLGASLRSVGVWRPVDNPSWREADIGSIARNYDREGMNLLYPRIDWRGDGPGYAEMEFPLLPWLMALVYRVTGENEAVGRFLSYVFSLCALFVFVQLARYLLPPAGAIGASVFFASSPLVIGMSYALQSDGLMLACYLLGAYGFIRWLDSNSWADYGVALAGTVLAIMAKASAAHVGLFMALLLFHRRGFAALSDKRAWMFGIAALLPAGLWYWHARQLWIRHGNSLGLSNEHHWVGWDFFTDPSFVAGIVRAEVLHVWMITGLMVAGVALATRRSDRAVSYALYWFAAVFAFYFLAARTTADEWAVYYHVVSAPAAALLAGAGVSRLRELLVSGRSRVVYAVAVPLLVAVTMVYVLAAGSLPTAWAPSLLVKLGMVAWLSGVVVVLSSYRWMGEEAVSTNGTHGRGTGIAVVVVGIALALPFVTSVLRPARSFDMRACAERFAPHIANEALIVASGGECRDAKGYPLAYNASYMFYWLDRKGWNICKEEQSIERLRELTERGARYFVAEKDAVEAKPGFAAALRAAFPMVAECREASLFRIEPAGDGRLGAEAGP